MKIKLSKQKTNVRSPQNLPASKAWRGRRIEVGGFTLIELLIVVSIIALLASIVLAVLVDARTGAKNNKRNELAKQYVTALALYHSEYGTYPTGGCTDSESCESIVYVCLGDGYPADDCYVHGEHSENATVNTQLSPFFESMPALTDGAIAGGQTFFGAAYGCLDLNTCKGYRLSWILEGEGSDAECFGGSEENDLGSISICTFTAGS